MTSRRARPAWVLGGPLLGLSLLCLPALASCRSAPLLGAPGETSRLGAGAAPGDERGPGSFVPRGTARSFYAGAGGRLWYYLNNYYWAPPGVPTGDLWIRAEVVEEYRDLRRWPDDAAIPSPPPKVTVEHWKVGPGGRSVRLDNHKDYCLLSDDWCAGAIEVRVTLQAGRVSVKDERGRWGRPKEAYVLEHRNYENNDPPGIGSDRARFEPLPGEPVNVWGYTIPWSTRPDRMTRSRWQELELPEWRLLARRAPAPKAPPAVTAPDG